jgi:endonuclease YncB( thermonuclease family)
VAFYQTDQYGRLVGKVLLDGRDIDLEQVKAGMVWHYKQHEADRPKPTASFTPQLRTKRAPRIGAFGIDPDPVEASEVRREQRQERRSRRLD